MKGYGIFVSALMWTFPQKQLPSRTIRLLPPGMSTSWKALVVVVSIESRTAPEKSPFMPCLYVRSVYACTRLTDLSVPESCLRWVEVSQIRIRSMIIHAGAAKSPLAISHRSTEASLCPRAALQLLLDQFLSRHAMASSDGVLAKHRYY